MLHLKMQPGSVIAAHIHEGVAEVLEFVEGDFINEGRPPHAVGTSLHVKADLSHGPHPTKNGCTILALWSDKGAIQNANLDDFKVTTPVEA